MVFLQDLHVGHHQFGLCGLLQLIPWLRLLLFALLLLLSIKFRLLLDLGDYLFQWFDDLLFAHPIYYNLRQGVTSTSHFHLANLQELLDVFIGDGRAVLLVVSHKLLKQSDQLFLDVTCVHLT